MIHQSLVCRDLVEVVSDWLDGALSAAERAEVEEHLAICPGCVAYVEQLRTTTRLLRHVGDEPMPPETRDRLLAAFRAWRAS
ncbi:MAG: anti-sigma factor [Actinomycetota bacterium]|nr:anti-sigma factor [Actinomycetota bacterium]